MRWKRKEDLVLEGLAGQDHQAATGGLRAEQLEGRQEEAGSWARE